MSDSETGSLFTDNTVFYDSKVLTSSVELVASSITINATQRVPEVFGLNQVIAYPGVPPEGRTVNFVATNFTAWAPRETITVTGPFGDDNKRTLNLTGTNTSGTVIFQEKVGN